MAKGWIKYIASLSLWKTIELNTTTWPNTPYNQQDSNKIKQQRWQI